MGMRANHVIVDLETMGTKPGCAVVSIGAVVFDPRCNLVTDKKFYVELDWRAQTLDGFSISKEVEVWWDKQSEAAREALHGLDCYEDTLKQFSLWLPKDCKIWGNGATFDISILENAYDKYNLPIPWKHYNIRDVRTIKDMYESKRGGYSRGMVGQKHNALDDAVHEAESVCAMWKSLLGD